MQYTKLQAKYKKINHNKMQLHENVFFNLFGLQDFSQDLSGYISKK